ncbi:thiamine diphosphokinase [Bacillus sp. REN10]|uniref:thiamine diphosphokinase n=1 Tax=Bacillus sp. REN10 TaxID=2782541 RepID=UPI00193BA419|nr:thiamine diphosphokinase [Bacillus sp. REN10]
MRIAVVASGPETELVDLQTYHTEDTIFVGVDRGTMYLLERGITPKVAIGDFDSVTEAEWQKIESGVGSDHIHRFPAEKDETDLELAILWAIKQQPETIIILGATGGRLDHFFGTISLLMNKEIISSATKIEIMDKQNVVSLYGPGTYTVFEDPGKKYFSFFAITSQVTHFTLKGFKYPLSDHTVKPGSTLYVSNELGQESGTFSFSSGILMMIRSSDG